MGKYMHQDKTNPIITFLKALASHPDMKPKGNGLHCRMIIEMVGAPEQHVVDTLKLILKTLKEEERGIEVLDGKVHKPKAQGEFFSTFVELDIIFEDMVTIAAVCFAYMPASIEIIEPLEMKLSATEANHMIDEFLVKLHDVDSRFKGVNAANQILDQNSMALLKNVIILTLKSGEKDMHEISINSGIKEEELAPFVERFVQEGLIKKAAGKYSLP